MGDLATALSLEDSAQLSSPGGSSHEAQVVHNSVFVLPGLQLLQGLVLMSSSPDLPHREHVLSF